MPVNRAYIAPYAQTDQNLYQALVALANFSDSMEKAVGTTISPNSRTQAAAPALPGVAITAANGHMLIEVTNPATATAPVQHQLQSSANQKFDSTGSTQTYTLGLGQQTLDVIAPNQPLYWRFRSRYQGSGWTQWQLYSSGTGGVAPVNAGPLKTS